MVRRFFLAAACLLLSVQLGLADEKTRGKISIWLGYPETLDAFKLGQAEFKKKYPNVEVDANSPAAEKRLNAGDVIVKVTDEEVANPADVQKRIDQLKKDGKKTALLLVANAEGDVRFVALALQ